MKRFLICLSLLAAVFLCPVLAAETGLSVMLNGEMLTFTKPLYRENGALMVPAAEMAAYLDLPQDGYGDAYVPVRRMASEISGMRVDWCQSAQTAVLTDVVGLAEAVCAQTPGLSEFLAWRPDIPVWLTVKGDFTMRQSTQSYNGDRLESTLVTVQASGQAHIYENGAAFEADIVTQGLDEQDAALLARLFGLSKTSVAGTLVGDTLYIRWPFLNKTASFLMAETDAKLAGSLMENFQTGWLSLTPPWGEALSLSGTEELMALWAQYAPHVYEELWQSLVPFDDAESLAQHLEWTLDNMFYELNFKEMYENDPDMAAYFEKYGAQQPDDSFLLTSYAVLAETAERRRTNAVLTRTEEGERVVYEITQTDSTAYAPADIAEFGAFSDASAETLAALAGEDYGTQAVLRLEAVNGQLTKILVRERSRHMWHASADESETELSLTLIPAEPAAAITPPGGSPVDITELLESWDMWDNGIYHPITYLFP